MLTFLHHVFLAEISGRLSLTLGGNESTPDDREEKTNRKRTLEVSVNNGPTVIIIVLLSHSGNVDLQSKEIE